MFLTSCVPEEVVIYHFGNSPSSLAATEKDANSYYSIGCTYPSKENDFFRGNNFIFLKEYNLIFVFSKEGHSTYQKQESKAIYKVCLAGRMESGKTTIFQIVSGKPIDENPSNDTFEYQYEGLGKVMNNGIQCIEVQKSLRSFLWSRRSCIPH